MGVGKLKSKNFEITKRGFPFFFFFFLRDAFVRGFFLSILFIYSCNDTGSISEPIESIECGEFEKFSFIGIHDVDIKNIIEEDSSN